MTWRRKLSTSVEHWNEVRKVFGVRPDRRQCVHCCVNWEWKIVENISTPLCATVEKEGNRSDRPEVSAELAATKHRAAVARVVYRAQNRLDLGVAAVELAAYDGGGEYWTPRW